MVNPEANSEFTRFSTTQHFTNTKPQRRLLHWSMPWYFG